MQRKIFIGIAISDAVKKRLMQKIEKWRNLPVNWSREENLHLTLSFLGHVDDELIYDICKNVREAVSNIDTFDIKLDKIELGPPRQASDETGPTQDKNARVVWFGGEVSAELKDLVESIEKELGIFTDSKKVFKPHITLGRIKKHKWQELEETPNISENFSVLLPIESVEVFESAVIEGKRKFESIESCPLKI